MHSTAAVAAAVNPLKRSFEVMNSKPHSTDTDNFRPREYTQRASLLFSSNVFILVYVYVYFCVYGFVCLSVALYQVSNQSVSDSNEAKHDRGVRHGSWKDYDRRYDHQRRCSIARPLSSSKEEIDCFLGSHCSPCSPGKFFFFFSTFILSLL